MANQKPTTVKGAVNPREIVWPHDTYGITSMLKKEGVRAVGRIKGDEEKLKVVIEVLQELAKHAKAKVADQRKEAAQKVKAAENRIAAETEINRLNQVRELERLEKIAADARSNFEAQHGKAANE